MNKKAFLTVDQILSRLRLSGSECILMFRSIVLLFELAKPDDDAFSIGHNRIRTYCHDNKIKIIPLTKVSEVDVFCKDQKSIQKKHSSGVIVFSHSGKNQLRQMIRHMRNACSHAGVSIVDAGGKEYVRLEAKDPRNNKTKLLALIPREHFQPFWNAVLGTLKFKPDQ